MNSMPKPGDDLDRVSDDVLRALVREYSLESPWWGSSVDRTLRDEVHERDLWLVHLYAAYRIASDADNEAQWASGEASPMRLDAKDSPGTAALWATYQAAMQAWVDGPKPVLSDRADAPSPDGRRSWEPGWSDGNDGWEQSRLDLMDAGRRWRMARKHTAGVTDYVVRVLNDAMERHGVGETTAAEALGTTRKTVRRWLGKDDAGERRRQGPGNTPSGS